MRISGYLSESLIDGPGVRLVVFFQGCNIKCAGCHNSALQNADGGVETTVGDVFANLTPLTNGITLSGGEPTNQPAATMELLKAAKERGLSTMLYTGLEVGEWLKHHKDLLAYLDYLKTGPYVESLKDLTRPYCGSTNQQVFRVKEGELIAI